jgi:hypothetical protein
MKPLLPMIVALGLLACAPTPTPDVSSATDDVVAPSKSVESIWKHATGGIVAVGDEGTGQR